jgi:hypothetical protein
MTPHYLAILFPKIPAAGRSSFQICRAARRTVALSKRRNGWRPKRLICI